MAKRSLSEKWQRLERQARQRAEELAVAVGGPGPGIALAQVAKAQRIERIEFLRMFSSGGLEITDTGFVIGVNCEDPREGNRWRDLFESGKDVLLPTYVRFTIAHEIAHTLLYDLTATPPKSLVGLEDYRSRDSLERTCNRAAGHLLVPTSRLQDATSGVNLFNCFPLQSLVSTFCVSLDVLINRIASIDHMSQANGAIALIRRIDGDLRIEALWISTVFGQLVPKAVVSAHFGTLFNHKHPFDLDHIVAPEAIQIPGQELLSGQMFQPCVLRCVKMSRSVDTYLVSLEAREAPVLIKHPAGCV